MKCSSHPCHVSAGAVIGQLGALVAWLVTCKAYYGSVNVDNLGGDYPMLAGNVTALGLSLIVTTVVTFIKPDNFDWDKMRTGIKMIEMDGTDLLKTSGEDSEEGLNAALKCALPDACYAPLQLSCVTLSTCPPCRGEPVVDDVETKMHALYAFVAVRWNIWDAVGLCRQQFVTAGGHTDGAPLSPFCSSCCGRCWRCLPRSSPRDTSPSGPSSPLCAPLLCDPALLLPHSSAPVSCSAYGRARLQLLG